jgi:hypothetical protein
MTRYHATTANTAAIVTILLAVPQANPVIAQGVLDAIAPPATRQRGGGAGAPAARGPGWPEEQPPVLTDEQRSALAAAARAASPELAAAFARIGQRWGMPDLFPPR